MMKRIFVGIILASFLLNLAWENLQAPLYEGYNGFWGHFPLCLLGTFGDIGAIMLGYILVGLTQKRMDWLNNIQTVGLVVFFLFELVLASLVEWYALSHNLWTYTFSMPTLSSFQIGILPLLQLGTTGILVLFITKSKVNDVLTSS